MKTKFFKIILLIPFVLLSISVFAQSPVTPAKGSKERKEILDIFREDFESPVLFKVNHFLIQNGWACAEVTPLENNVEIGDQRWGLFRLNNGKWIPIEWSKNIEIIDDFELIDLPAQNSRISKLIIKNYPSCPMSIFSKRK